MWRGFSLFRINYLSPERRPVKALCFLSSPALRVFSVFLSCKLEFCIHRHIVNIRRIAAVRVRPQASLGLLWKLPTAAQQLCLMRRRVIMQNLMKVEDTGGLMSILFLGFQLKQSLEEWELLRVWYNLWSLTKVPRDAQILPQIHDTLLREVFIKK